MASSFFFLSDFPACRLGKLAFLAKPATAWVAFLGVLAVLLATAAVVLEVEAASLELAVVFARAAVAFEVVSVALMAEVLESAAALVTFAAAAEVLLTVSVVDLVAVFTVAEVLEAAVAAFLIVFESRFLGMAKAEVLVFFAVVSRD